MSDHPLSGAGTCEVAAAPGVVWLKLLDPDTLRALIPGTERVERTGARYEAWLSYGVGRVRSHYHVELNITDQVPPESLALAGRSKGGLGHGRAAAVVTLAETAAGRTTITWRYEGVIGGPVALLGRFMLRSAARVFVGRFFAALAQQFGSQASAGGRRGLEA